MDQRLAADNAIRPGRRVTEARQDRGDDDLSNRILLEVRTAKQRRIKARKHGRPPLIWIIHRQCSNLSAIEAIAVTVSPQIAAGNPADAPKTPPDRSPDRRAQPRPGAIRGRSKWYHPASACRPSSVIVSHFTSIRRRPARIARRSAVASPSRTKASSIAFVKHAPA
jgi:hypothetical protein